MVCWLFSCATAEAATENNRPTINKALSKSIGLDFKNALSNFIWDKLNISSQDWRPKTNIQAISVINDKGCNAAFNVLYFNLNKALFIHTTDYSRRLYQFHQLHFGCFDFG